MDVDGPPPTGIFVVAAWREPDARPPVRARITRTPDVGGTSVTVSGAASVEEACARLREWWAAVAGG